MSGIWRDRLSGGVAAATLTLMLAFAGGPVHADTLKGAMLKAYRSNPTLQAERARQRGTDELVPQAKSGWRPQVNAQIRASKTWTSTNGEDTLESSSRAYSIQLSQPLFRGMKTVEGTAQAKALVESGRYRVSAVEQDILLRVADAYLSVIRDRAIASLRERNVSNLRKQVSAAQARFEAGEVTRTDVTQARSRVSGAQASLASARSQLNSSLARYEQLVGDKAGTLARPKPARLPSSLEAALDVARQTNPNILAAQEARHAQEHAIEVAKGDLLPSAELNANHLWRDSQSQTAFGDSRTTTSSSTIEAVANFPIYEGGRIYSEVRQAKQVESQRQLEVIAQGRNVRQTVKSAWYDVISAREAIVAAKAQVSAAELSLDGVTQEYLVGSRSTVDILNAEQEVTNARINLVQADYSYIVSTYELCAAMGRLTAMNLELGGPYYDVKENYVNVKDKWIGTQADVIE